MRSRFGIFDHIENIRGTPTSQLFKDRIELIKMADQAGFHGFHLAEHHGGNLCMSPSQEVFIAAASQVTEHIHMGPLVKLLPMHAPARVIEDMCVLDNLLEGRLEYGVGRGAVPVEHHWFESSYDVSRAKFDEALRIIHRALQTGEISSDGCDHYDFPPMPLAIKPYQDRIPFWYPGNPNTAGRHGMGLIWPGKVPPDAYELYVAAWNEHNNSEVRFDGPGDEPRVGYSMLLAIDEDEDKARDVARRGMEGLVRNTTAGHHYDYLVMPSEEDRYNAQAALRAIMSGMDEAIAFGAGTPSQIAERVAMLLEDGMCEYIAFMFPAGDMSIDESKRTLDLFATEVMPQLGSAAVTG
jgi:alkanesulfonate monooxygenase SsuD/methylene tetrahydromethanopterin reductase-like flavin-dependent oxidoreductase (luciferase family)